MQLLPFSVNNLVDKSQLTLIQSVAALGSMLYIPEIYDLEHYLVCDQLFLNHNIFISFQEDLKILVDNTLDAFDHVDGGQIIDNMKLHLLIHVVDDIRNHGLLVHAQSEVFESYNSVFHLCSILSNQQAPSKDIAHKFAQMERTKHTITGGFWEDEDGIWKQAGKGVRDALFQYPLIQTHLGWSPHSSLEPGIFFSELR